MSDVESEGEIEDFDSASFPSDMDDTELYVLDGLIHARLALECLHSCLEIPIFLETC